MGAALILGWGTMQTRVIYVVMGLPQHGKSTFSRMLSEETGLATGMTSTLVYEVLSKMENLPPGADWHQLIPADEQGEFRKKLVVLGDAICDLRQSILPETLMARGASIIEGVRRPGELQAFTAYCAQAGIAVRSFWVSRPDGPDIRDNTFVTASDASEVIYCANLEELREKARAIAKQHERRDTTEC